jgi:hypothetical protein
MSTSTVPEKTSSNRKPARLRNKNGQFRARKNADHPTAKSTGAESVSLADPKSVRSLAGGEQLLIAVAALAFGLVGLAFHALWIVSIILMALLVGLLGSEARRQRGRGLVAEVVAEAKGLADEIGTPALAPADEVTSESTSEEKPGGAEVGS